MALVVNNYVEQLFIVAHRLCKYKRYANGADVSSLQIMIKTVKRLICRRVTLFCKDNYLNGRLVYNA